MSGGKLFFLVMLVAVFVGATCSQAADIGLTKGVTPASPNIYQPGDTIHYVMTVENLHPTETIRVDLVEDTLPDGTVVTMDSSANPAYPDFPFELIAGASQAYTIDWLVPMDASGYVVNDLRCVGVQYSTVNDPFDAHVQKTSLVITPCIDVTKDVDCGISKVGDGVVYHICVTNCGNIDLLNLSVNDDVMGDISSYFPSELTAGQMACADIPYVIQGGDPDPLINTVTAMAEDITGGMLSDFDTATVDLIHPSVEVTKVCMTDPVAPGGDADFLVTITNTGDCTLIISTDEAELPGPITILAGADYQETVTRSDPGGVDCVYNDINIAWTLPAEYCNMSNAGTAWAEACCPVEGGEEGCTPGFWKNHPACWCADFQPDDLLGDVFTIPSELSDYADDSLMMALGYGGGNGVEGAARNLFRSAVSALLNACSDDINYPLGVSAVISDVNAALATLDRHEILTLHSMLDTYNNYGCSIDAHCLPIMEESSPITTP